MSEKSAEETDREAQWASRVGTLEDAPRWGWDHAEDEALALAGVARIFAGHGCTACGGQGSRAYGSTSSWRGGIGGQSITSDVCDRCWGTGRSDRTGPDLRAIERELRTLRAKVRAMERGT